MFNNYLIALLNIYTKNTMTELSTNCGLVNCKKLAKGNISNQQQFILNIISIYSCEPEIEIN